MKTVLSIAGSDCSGGAGIQADIKTITMQGAYAMSAITALTAQNTTGVYGIMEVTPEFLEQQIDAVFTDIRPDAVKTGMVADVALIKVIADKLKEYQAEHIVVDPVMVSTSGSRLLKEEAVETMRMELLPLAELVTPNIPEAEVLAGMTLRKKEDMITAARQIYEQYGCAVLCKGGHNAFDGGGDSDDLLYTPEGYQWICGERINNPNTHGTGCTLSSAIAANLAKGLDMQQAVEKAKQYIAEALAAGLNLGKGSGPLQHNYSLCETIKTA